MLTDALYQEFNRSAKETPCLDSPARNTSRLQVTPLLGLKVSGSASTPMSDGGYWLLDVTFVGVTWQDTWPRLLCAGVFLTAWRPDSGCELIGVSPGLQRTLVP